MPAFTTRIELHDATSANYEKLHEEMEARGFSREIKGRDGTWKQLPTAEYNLTGDFTRSDVLDKADAAIAAIRKTGMTLVTESAGRTWRNLPEAS
jgi:hypothetical protein